MAAHGMQDRPNIGVGVFVLNQQNEFVFGRRKGVHGPGTWALPGGHLEVHESFEECARREVLEEIGMEIEDLSFLTATNSPYIDGSKHYVTIFMTARPKIPNAQPALLEPDKCEGWDWMQWSTLLEWCEHQSQENSAAFPVDTSKLLFDPMIALVRQRPGLHPSLLMKAPWHQR